MVYYTDELNCVKSDFNSMAAIKERVVGKGGKLLW